MWTILLTVAFWAQEPPAVTFGTTVVRSSGFRGQIYDLKAGTELLPNLRKMKPVGTIYTNAINVPTQEFQRGFPGITTRFEWFAIAYDGKFWIENEGRYGFTVLSDDGSQLWVDEKMVVDNDGIHQPNQLEGSAILTRGVHAIRLAYFQGPRHQVALTLAITPPGEPARILDTDAFMPPKDPSRWVPGKIRSVKKAENPWPEGPKVPYHR